MICLAGHGSWYYWSAELGGRHRRLPYQDCVNVMDDFCRCLSRCRKSWIKVCSLAYYYTQAVEVGDLDRSIKARVVLKAWTFHAWVIFHRLSSYFYRKDESLVSPRDVAGRAQNHVQKLLRNCFLVSNVFTMCASGKQRLFGGEGGPKVQIDRATRVKFLGCNHINTSTSDPIRILNINNITIHEKNININILSPIFYR